MVGGLSSLVGYLVYSTGRSEITVLLTDYIKQRTNKETNTICVFLCMYSYISYFKISTFDTVSVFKCIKLLASFFVFVFFFLTKRNK